MEANSGDNPKKTGPKQIPSPPPEDGPALRAWLSLPRVMAQAGYPRLKCRDYVQFERDLRAFVDNQRKRHEKRARDAEKQRKYRQLKRLKPKEETVAI